MTFYLEINAPAGRRLLMLAGERVTIGKDASNAAAIDWDDQVSRLHAVLEPYASGWAIRDLGSTNGTFVNGQRLWSEQTLHPGDELRFGHTIVGFMSDAGTGLPATKRAAPPPDLTRRERDVLEALCAPLVSGDVFTEPASLREIGAQLFVTEAAVKQHLQNLYDKFALYEPDKRKRVRLANEAIRRGAITLATLKPRSEPQEP